MRAALGVQEMIKSKEKEKETHFETIELRGSIKDKKMQEQFSKAIQRAMKKVGDNK